MSSLDDIIHGPASGLPPGCPDDYPTPPKPPAECPKSPTGKHDYRQVESTWDWEKYRCTYCGDTYKIYEEDLK